MKIVRALALSLTIGLTACASVAPTEKSEGFVENKKKPEGVEVLYVWSSGNEKCVVGWLTKPASKSIYGEEIPTIFRWSTKGAGFFETLPVRNERFKIVRTKDENNSYNRDCGGAPYSTIPDERLRELLLQM